ncbi:MAG: glycerol-3-phosphate dehydrogenase [Bacteroidia bacterium]|nr:glycerol-3-phosphate dehydrogenase [Bacteroidia bacterium]MDW8301314.1 glycerol-3-phosphate dehydrogenase [Bacteroidia bacterium]
MVSIVGGGSLATVLAKLLAQHDFTIYWWMRDAHQIAHILEYRQNPKYIPDLYIPENVVPTQDWDLTLKNAEFTFLVVPSAFLKQVLPSQLPQKCIYVSGIKGLLYPQNQTVSQSLIQDYSIPAAQIVVISGPTHAEEMAQQQLSYLHIASTDLQTAQKVENLLKQPYLRTTLTQDVLGIEYFGAIKNVMAIAMGIVNGLGYGDNFKATFFTYIIKEIEQLLKFLCPNSARNILDSVYLGDALVTAYSQYSRNRMFGSMIGRGYSIKSAQLEMKMVAEGYYALQSIYELIQDKKDAFSITNMLYKIIYQFQPPRKTVQQWIEQQL